MEHEEEVIPELMDQFPLGFVRHAIASANYVLSTACAKAWTPEEMRAKWRRRSLNQILEEKDINHRYPCADSAVLAAHFLNISGQNAYLRFMTDAERVRRFRLEQDPIIHVDCVTELRYEGKTYGFDIGAGDLTFISPSQVVPRKEFPEERVWKTTRHEEGSRYWHRTTVMVVSGKTITDNPDTPLLKLLH